ncbi:MAG: sulfotransferase domain-containing protein [Alphaproteobacteria bacterium]
MNNLRRIIWLASFPKSGNTWIRSFLSNYFQPPGKTLDINNLRHFTTSDVRHDFFDKAVGRPYRGKTVDEWIAVRPKALRLIAASKPGHHFVKTHCQVGKVNGVDLIMPEVTAAAIYLIRNPFDVAPSYARHMSLNMEATIDRMANGLATHASANGVMEITGRWDDHIRNWTTAPGLPLHVMRYEDMLANAGKAYRSLFDFLRVPVDKAQMRRTLKATAFRALQKQESESGFGERPPEMKQFFSTGRAGGWREELTPAHVARIRAEFLPILEQWYPEMLVETRDFAESGSGGA